MKGVGVVSNNSMRCCGKAPLILVIILSVALLVAGAIELGRAQLSYDWAAAENELEEVHQDAQEALSVLSAKVQDCEDVLAQIEADGLADPSAIAAARKACDESESLTSAGVAEPRQPVGETFAARLSSYAASLLDTLLVSQRASEGAAALDEAMDAVVWVVPYHDDFLGLAAEDDSVTQWMDGFFLAHRWSENGERIASMPTYVSVDGLLYRYVSSITVPKGTTWEEVEGFIQANGGIGFETCVDSEGSEYLLTHYEPL